MLGKRFTESAIAGVIGDVAAGRYDDITTTGFLVACAARGLDRDEMAALTRAMVNVGERLVWEADGALDALVAAGFTTVATTNSIANPTGRIDLCDAVAQAMLELSRRP